MPTQNSRLVVHVGTVKTGTTYIQKLIHENKSVLQNIHLHYPHLTTPDLDLPRYSNANFLLKPADPIDPDEQLLIDDFTTIISEETLFFHIDKLDFFAEESIEKKIICYIRKPADLISAWASEMSQPYNAYVPIFSSNAGPLDIADSINELIEVYQKHINYNLDYFHSNNNWNIVARPYDESQFLYNNILSDVICCAGLGEVNVLELLGDAALQRANPSASRKFCDISRAVWIHLGQPRDHAIYNTELVAKIYSECLSGDDRPIIQTLSDNWIAETSKALKYFEMEMHALSGLDGALFENHLPATFQTHRAEYLPIDLDEVRSVTDRCLKGI